MPQKSRRFGCDLQGPVVHASNDPFDKSESSPTSPVRGLAGLPGPSSQYGGLAAGPNRSNGLAGPVIALRAKTFLLQRAVTSSLTSTQTFRVHVSGGRVAA